MKKGAKIHDILEGLDADLYLLDLAVAHGDSARTLRLRVQLMRKAIARAQELPAQKKRKKT